MVIVYALLDPSVEYNHASPRLLYISTAIIPCCKTPKNCVSSTGFSDCLTLTMRGIRMVLVNRTFSTADFRFWKSLSRQTLTLLSLRDPSDHNGSWTNFLLKQCHLLHGFASVLWTVYVTNS